LQNWNATALIGSGRPTAAASARKPQLAVPLSARVDSPSLLCKTLRGAEANLFHLAMLW